jgi:hypothetical protein
MIQRPSTLDTACALALVQEEAADSVKRREGRCYDPFSYRQGHKSAYQSLPPPKYDKPNNSVPEDKKGLEDVRVASSDDKICALRQYRRARGLCDRCAEKWSSGHKCSATVQLHVVQELWELLSDDEGASSEQCATEISDDPSQLCLCLSEAAVLGVESPKSMRLVGQIQGHSVMILVDSGSSHTFVSCAGTALIA